MKKTIVVIAALAATLAWALACRGGYLAGDGKLIKRTRFMMDTLCTIQARNEQGRFKTEAAINRAFDRMAEIDRKFNCTNPESPIYKFNHDRTPITDPEIYGLVKKSVGISRETGGAFDITAYPLVDLWGFFTTSASSQTVPSPAAIKLAMSKVGWRRILLSGAAVTPADPGVMLDLGGIAKGYSIAEAERILKTDGIKSALILAGGQVQVFGSAGEGDPWKVGVRNPRKEGYMAGLVFTEETGISTSGDYERFFEVNGVRYHHILDTKTGYPAKGLMSVSVITPDPVRADALSTALFVLGEKRALDFVRAHPDLDAIIVNDKGAVSNSRENPADAKL